MYRSVRNYRDRLSNRMDTKRSLHFGPYWYMYISPSPQQQPGHACASSKTSRAWPLDSRSASLEPPKTTGWAGRGGRNTSLHRNAPNRTAPRHCCTAVLCLFFIAIVSSLPLAHSLSCPLAQQSCVFFSAIVLPPSRPFAVLSSIYRFLCSFSRSLAVL